MRGGADVGLQAVRAAHRSRHDQLLNRTGELAAGLRSTAVPCGLVGLMRRNRWPCKLRLSNPVGVYWYSKGLQQGLQTFVAASQNILRFLLPKLWVEQLQTDRTAIADVAQHA